MVKHSPRSHPCCKAGRGRGFYQWDAPFSGGRCVWPCWPLWTRRLGPQGRMLPHILRVDIHACAVRACPGFAMEIDWSGHPLGCLCDARQWPQPWCTPPRRRVATSRTIGHSVATVVCHTGSPVGGRSNQSSSQTQGEHAQHTRVYPRAMCGASYGPGVEGGVCALHLQGREVVSERAEVVAKWRWLCVVPDGWSA